MIVSVPEPGEIVDTSMGKMELEDTEVKLWGRTKFFVRFLYKDMLEELAKDMRRNISEDFDNFVVIYGGEGSGKSNLAWNLISKFDPDFDLESGYVYNSDIFMEILEKKIDLREKTLWLDEGSNVANNRDWNTAENKGFVLYTETMRSKRNTFIICVPTKERLDIYLRDSRTRYMIKCEPMSFERLGPRMRGYFELHKRTPTGQMQIIGYGTYDKMPPDIKEKYEALKARSQESIADKIVNRVKGKTGQKYKEKYESKCKEMDSVLLALHESGHDADGLMQLFGFKNKRTFYNRLEEARKRRGSENGATEEDD